MINIAELLKDAPKDMKLYSPLFGEVKFKYINGSKFGIVVEDSEECSRSFDKYGRYFTIYNNAECLLFPAKGQSWEEWKVNTCKFKVLDWIVRNNGSSDVPVQIYGLKKDRYLVTNMLGSKGELMINKQDKWRIWTIKDAKDGDVLVSGIDNPFIYYKPYYDDGHAYYYVGIDGRGNLSIACFRKKPDLYLGSINDVIPATKEQRDQLFAKIKEAGYEWDAEKKELRKIKPHYDISNLHAGMPVLVRETSLNAWQYVPFSHCYIGGDGSTRFNAGLVGFTQCIPFNDDTKHLLGTTDMPSEEYINW